MAENQNGKEINTEVKQLETIGDYINAVNTALLDCCSKLGPEESKNDDNSGIWSLVYSALNNCEALYAASRIKGKASEMFVTPEIFYPSCYINATSSSFQMNPQVMPKLAFEAPNGLLLHCYFLYYFTDYIKEIQKFIDSPAHFTSWPRNPQARMFTSAGLSWLEASFNFTKELSIQIAELLNPLIDKLLIENPQYKSKVKVICPFSLYQLT